MVSNHRSAVSEEKSNRPQAGSGSSGKAVQSRAWRRIATAITLLVAGIPAFFAARWVYRYGVDVPLKDDWDAADLVVKAHAGLLSWADLFQQQQEARYVLPKLLFIAASAGGHWDVRRLMWLSLMVCVLTALCLFWLLGKAGLSGLTRALCFWGMSLLIFSAAQYELWPWASGLPCFLPPFFLVVALCTLETQRPVRTKFILCAALSLVASFTLPQGLLLWALTFPLLILRGEVEKWRGWIGAWLIAAALCAGAYFYGYSRPAQSPEFAPAVSMLGYADYFFAFLGNELAYATRDYRIAIATGLGLVLFALYLAAIARAFVQRNDRELIRRSLPWFAVGGFAIGAAGLATLGRVGFGIESAISSRYVASSLYLSVSVIALVAIMARDIGLRSLRFTFYAIVFVLCAAFLTLHTYASARSVRFMESASAKTRLARGGVLFGQVIDTSEAVQPALYFDATWVKSYAAKLDDLKLLRPALVRTPNLDQLPHAAADGKAASGEWITSAAAPNELSRASGWAFLNAKGRPADAVVLACDEVGAGVFVFAMENEVSRRHRTRRGKLEWSGWSAAFPRSAVPASSRISAWALDAEIPMLYRLNETEGALAP